jgi:predicted CXXCH cytochrome family protein
MTIDKCEGCHNAAMANSQLDSLRKAGHALCKGCHSNERAKGRMSAPSSCGACHPSALQE